MILTLHDDDLREKGSLVEIDGKKGKGEGDGREKEKI